MTSPTPKAPALAWIVLLGAIVQLTFSPGPVIFGAWGILAPDLTKLLQTNLGGVMLALTAFNVGAIVAAPFTGRIIDKIGVRGVLAFALVCLIAGFAVIGFGVKALWQLYLVAFLWGVLTLGAQSISYTKLLTGWFVEKRGLALGIAAAGLGLGYAIVPLVASWASNAFGWQAAALVLGGLVALGPLLIGLPLAFTPPQDRVTGAAVPTVPGLTLSETLRTPIFWFLAASVLLVSVALTGMTPHIVLFGKDVGLTPALAAEAAAFYGLATVVGRILAGWLLDRFAPAQVTACLFACAVIGFGILALMTTGLSGATWLFVAIFLMGLGFGAETDVIGFMIARFFGRHAFGQIYGCLLSAFVLGAALGPPLIGFSHDHWHGYTEAMWGGAIACAVAIGLILQLAKYKPFTATE